MLFSRHVSRQIGAHLDGRLKQAVAERVELHLQQCATCRAECEQVRDGISIVAQLPLIEAPDALWLSIEASLQTQRPRRMVGPRWAWVAAAAAFTLTVAAWFWVRPSRTKWEVTRLDGSPTVETRPLSGLGAIAPGQWMETDSGSRASIKVGEIGSLEVEPNTRLRVVTAQAGELRVALARGEIRARISAPPRLFFVDTASGTAVDLGCEYQLNSDEQGSGMLRVTRGWVLFQWNGLESLVPAGANCRIRPLAGPGIPYFDDASDPLKQALDAFGFEKSADDGLGVILAESRVRDTLSLWHLLSRVDSASRARVFDRIAALTPIPADISRQRALELDADTLKRWREALAWTW